MFEWLASPEAWIALATLASLEIVLGIDNIIFISILVGRLPDRWDWAWRWWRVWFCCFRSRG